MRLWLSMLMIIFLLQGPYVEDVSYMDELELLLEANENLDTELELQDWEQVIVFDMEEKVVKETVDILKKRYNFQKEINDQSIKYHFANQPLPTLNISVHIIVSNDHGGKAQCQIVMNGSVWNDSVINKLQESNKMLTDLLNIVEYRTFSCIKLNGDGIIMNGKLVQKYLENLNVTDVRKFEDKLLSSNYGEMLDGYSPLFEDWLTIDKQKMNVQMVIKNNKSQLIIGTPIMVNEY